MTFVDNLALGLSVAATPANIGFCFVGAMLGTLVGVLPGLGPMATIALLLPFTYGLDPISALIMLAGIYYGAQYGGSTTSILLNLPGEASSVVTCIDGHQMARQGRAGAALTIAALGSLFAGLVGTVIIALWGPPLAAFAQKFASPEYFSLMVLGLVAAVVLARGSLFKAVAAILIGVLIGLIGLDRTSGIPRYAFGQAELFDGIGFVPVAMGIFGLAEIIGNLQNKEAAFVTTSPVGKLWLTKEDVKASWLPVVRGTALGSLLGILPGGGAMLSSFASYTVERSLAKDRTRFGNGAIEGVAGPESANNAGAQTSFIPLLTLGIPSNGIMALLMGCMLIQGIQPGPEVMVTRPDLYWGLVVSMLIGNIMLVVINLPLVGIWVKLLKVPYHLLFPPIVIICCIGVYSLNNSVFEVAIMAACAGLGFTMRRAGMDAAPLLLGIILGPLLEEHLRRSMNISMGDPTVFFTRPVAATLLVVAVCALVFAALPAIRQAREKSFAGDD